MKWIVRWRTLINWTVNAWNDSFIPSPKQVVQTADFQGGQQGYAVIVNNVEELARHDQRIEAERIAYQTSFLLS